MHRESSRSIALTYDAWLRVGRKFVLDFTEVEAGSQTQISDPPTLISLPWSLATRRVFRARPARTPAEVYALHEMMNRFRGRECGRKLAAALGRHTQNTADPLPEDL